jgi:hypothetical protein
LRVRNENIHLGSKPTRIIKTAGKDSHEWRITRFKFGSCKSRPAFGTITAFMLASSDAGREMVTQLSARQSKRLCRYQDCGNKSAATHLLAIAAMAFQHHDRFCSTFVTNRAAGAATGERYFHIHLQRASPPAAIFCSFKDSAIDARLFVSGYLAFVSGSMIPKTLPAGSAA